MCRRIGENWNQTLVLSSERDGDGNEHGADGDHGETSADATQPGKTREHVAGAEEQHDGDAIRDAQREVRFVHEDERDDDGKRGENDEEELKMEEEELIDLEYSFNFSVSLSCSR